MGKLVDCTNNVRLEALIFISASANKDMVSSNNRPFDCTAIRNIINNCVDSHEKCVAKIDKMFYLSK